MNSGPEVNCPQCKKKFFYYTSDYRPFCCKRCKLVDLGHWLDESYAIASKGPLKEDDPELAELEDEWSIPDQAEGEDEEDY